MDDKFIMVNIDDEKSKYIAEVLKSKTAKKILDFLSETKEASEQDISKALEIPINTAEYNLKKLLDAGLIEKAKNFFWSRKGRKIDLYKLTKKHIVISPKISRPTMNMLKGIIPIIIGITLILILVALFGPGQEPVSKKDQAVLNQFGSYAELKNFVKESAESFRYYDEMFTAKTGTVTTTGVSEAAGAGTVAGDFSQTNIQVEGVDEADIVKNDGKYIYAVSGKNVVIVDAYPAEDMQVLSEIETNKNIREIFVNDDKLVVFIGSYYGSSGDSVEIYDISDRGEPVLEQEIEMDGSYVNSRMIGNYVYVISSKYVRIDNPQPPVYKINGLEKRVSAGEVYYSDYPDTSYVFTSIGAINLEDNEFNSETYLTGGARNIYVSQDNIYLTYTRNIRYDTYLEQIVEEVYLPILPGSEDKKVREIMDSNKPNYQKMNEIQAIVFGYSKSLRGDEKADFDKELMEKFEEFDFNIQKKYTKTVVHKININKDEINYEGDGEVIGRVLNQFSMDEFNGYFRIATTTGNTWQSSSLNHLYVLDEDMDVVGSVEDLAKGESIYSARFLGERAYIVTFKKVDPLFVIDLSKPDAPEVLGYLKITGYSNYLHPYDENHIIGIGKETRGGNEQFSWYQGIKISLFDVSDVENPKEKAKIEIGDRGTDSYALYDHKAFLFSKERNLLIVPVLLAEINESRYSDEYGYDEIPDNAYGDPVWQGAYVLNIDLQDISVRGKITHDDNFTEMGRYYYNSRFAVKRSLYMDNYIYTVSNSRIKANNLQTIHEISDEDLNYEGRTNIEPEPVF